MDSVSRLFSQLKDTDDQTFIKKTILYHGALINHGLKPAVFISFKQNNYNMLRAWATYSKEVLHEQQLSSCLINHDMDRFSVLVFNREALINTLNIKKTRQWLVEYAAYAANATLKQDLACLKERFALYPCPDELGVFLGYPIEDVVSYVQHQGKNFAYCGYWKVYHNLDQCIERFQEYDRVRIATAEKLLDYEKAGIAI